MRILGIDPGLQRTGYGVVDVSPDPGRPRLVEAGVIRTDSAALLEARLAEIDSGLAEVLAELRPEVVAVEQLYAHYRHPRTAILMGHARGVIFLAAARAGLPVVGYSATRIKKALVGTGHASKHQVQRAIQGALGLDAAPEPPDVADALAVALCHAHRAARTPIKDTAD